MKKNGNLKVCEDGSEIGCRKICLKNDLDDKEIKKGRRRKNNPEEEISSMDNHKHYIGKWGWWKYQNNLLRKEISDRIREI